MRSQLRKRKRKREGGRRENERKSRENDMTEMPLTLLLEKLSNVIKRS